MTSKKSILNFHRFKLRTAQLDFNFELIALKIGVGLCEEMKIRYRITGMADNIRKLQGKAKRLIGNEGRENRSSIMD